MDAAKDFFERMRSKGADIGTLVEVMLKLDVSFDYTSSIAPTYHRRFCGADSGETKDLELRFCGYIVGFGAPCHKEALCLSNGYIKGSVRCLDGARSVHIDVEAIQSYKILK